jgi:predicted regulator of Ras-like GTPase activity (Roadblock/LC7/MglB family)
MTAPTPATDGNLNWLLCDLVRRVPGTRHALVLSQDGLVVGHSDQLARPDADRLSAAAAALSSLARSIGRDFQGGAVRQTLIEMEDAFCFLTAAGKGAHLVVMTEESVDVAVVAFEMNILVKRVGEHLGAKPRAGADGPV